MTGISFGVDFDSAKDTDALFKGMLSFACRYRNHDFSIPQTRRCGRAEYDCSR